MDEENSNSVKSIKGFNLAEFTVNVELSYLSINNSNDARIKQC